MKHSRVFAAFGQGMTPTIAVINKATVPLGVDFTSLVTALQKYVDTCLTPVWGTPAYLTIAKDFVPGTWALVFLDNADVAGALGLHDLTPDGFPLSKVFVKTTLSAGEKVSMVASHEIAECLADGACNLCAQASNGTLYALEICDPCEAQWFYLNSIPMSDFVFPSWFEPFRSPNSTQFDYLRKISSPFQLLSGGYAIIFKRGKWSQIFGSEQKKNLFTKEDRRGHRSEYRKPVKV